MVSLGLGAIRFRAHSGPVLPEIEVGLGIRARVLRVIRQILPYRQTVNVV